MKPPVFNYDDYVALQAKYDAMIETARELAADNHALKEELKKADNRARYIESMAGTSNW